MRRVLICCGLLVTLWASNGSASPVGAFGIAVSHRNVTSEHLRIDKTSQSFSSEAAGAFDHTASVGNAQQRTLSASQQSEIGVTGSSLVIHGTGSTSAARILDAGASEHQKGESVLDAEFSVSTDSFYDLIGKLVVRPDVPYYPNSGLYDNSTGFVELVEIGGNQLLSSNANGIFSKRGVLQSGRSYRLRIGSTIWLQTTNLFTKTNSWELSFHAMPVPEPASCAMGCSGLIALAALRRRK